ncbi:hypothetical protein GCM10023160_14090 [Brachybacterium paraconglomeratum]|uniref:NAD(P)-dependent oxidoreductase n=1 Tax=Brachybacterium paraconglomeratum TaxID=173362 RepID=UPI0031E5496B
MSAQPSVPAAAPALVPRRVIVFGASGTVGTHVLDQGLAQGHEITAFTRSRTAISARHPHLEIVEGDVFDAPALVPVLSGHDAVIVTLGAGGKGGVRGRATAAIATAMSEAGVRRLIVQTSLGVGDSRPALTPFWKYAMFGLLLRGAYADHHEQEQITRESGLDWTITRPGAFVDGNRTGQYRRGFPSVRGRKVATVAPADVADFRLEQLADERWLHQSPNQGYVTGVPRPTSRPLTAHGAHSD